MRCPPVLEVQPLSLSHGSPWEIENCAHISWKRKLRRRITQQAGGDLGGGWAPPGHLVYIPELPGRAFGAEVLLATTLPEPAGDEAGKSPTKATCGPTTRASQAYLTVVGQLAMFWVSPRSVAQFSMLVFFY